MHEFLLKFRQNSDPYRIFEKTKYYQNKCAWNNCYFRKNCYEKHNLRKQIKFQIFLIIHCSSMLMFVFNHMNIIRCYYWFSPLPCHLELKFYSIIIFWQCSEIIYQQQPNIRHKSIDTGPGPPSYLYVTCQMATSHDFSCKSLAYIAHIIYASCQYYFPRPILQCLTLQEFNCLHRFAIFSPHTFLRQTEYS